MNYASEAETASVQGFPVLNARLDLPDDLAWFNELSAGDRIEFFSGLLDILASDGDNLLAMLGEYLRGWRATVEICSSPELTASYEQAKDDLHHRRFLTYEEVFSGV